jgi:hypothetical protein
VRGKKAWTVPHRPRKVQRQRGQPLGQARTARSIAKFEGLTSIGHDPVTQMPTLASGFYDGRGIESCPPGGRYDPVGLRKVPDGGCYFFGARCEVMPA